jgi:dTDP-4-dehydrorhamnose reductase
MQALASGNRKWVYKIDDNFQISKEGTIELLVKLKKADAIYHYAKFFIVDEEEYREQLQQALIDSGDVHYIAEFANNITWADKARLQKALKDTKAKRKTLKLEDLVEDVENGVLQ